MSLECSRKDEVKTKKKKEINAKLQKAEQIKHQEDLELEKKGVTKLVSQNVIVKLKVFGEN